ncbi:thioredoxin family protein [Cecembia calidifontis]|jgi:thioredoxin-like negative regulator of GroEL|uniref:Thioredoxin n=1 Tax=Cecembia calidifontis TaxID=1187080 RepID=A0A4Q7PG38_9BACT|nr:thioredoxin family protein [Cecembia calidifontis]RZS98680.1 thioredoxin [Cecembia calidifontis]
MELDLQYSVQEFEEMLQQKPAVMVYFYQETCGVCKILFPKVKELVEDKFPQIELIVLEAEKNKELAAQLRMLAVPGILIYFDGKEFFRSNGLITLHELERKVERPYLLFFS